MIFCGGEFLWTQQLGCLYARTGLAIGTSISTPGNPLNMSGAGPTFKRLMLTKFSPTIPAMVHEKLHVFKVLAATSTAYGCVERVNRIGPDSAAHVCVEAKGCRALLELRSGGVLVGRCLRRRAEERARMHMCVCVRGWVRGCVGACACVRVWARACLRVQVRARALVSRG